MISDIVITQGAQQANQVLLQSLQSIAPLFKQAEQVVQAKMPKPQMPPNEQAAMNIAQMENARKTELDKATIGFKQQEFAAKQKMDQMSLMMEQQQQAFENRMVQMEASSKAQNEALMGQVKLMQNKQDNDQHQITELLKNADDNKTAIETKLMELRHQVASAKPGNGITLQAGDVSMDFTDQLKEMQNMLSQEGDAKVSAAINPIMEHLQTMMGPMQTMMTHMTAPKRIVRDPATGRAIGVEPVVPPA